jgi:hypothetical protein
MTDQKKRVRGILQDLSDKVTVRKNQAKDQRKWAIYRADAAQDEKQVELERRIAERWRLEAAAHEHVEILLSSLLKSADA